MIDELTTDTFFEALKTDKLVLVDFYAAWCVPCNRLMTILPKFAKDVQDLADVKKVDVDKSSELKKLYSVTKVPTFIIFKNGLECWRIEGKILTLAEMRAQLQEIHHGSKEKE